MLLKNHLIEVFKQASLENNILLKENVVLKWVHRFGIDSLNDLLLHSPVPRDYQHKKENQEQIELKLLKKSENIEETKRESNVLEISKVNEKISKNQDSNNTKQYINPQKSPLPNIKNLRKWINNDKKAS